MYYLYFLNIFFDNWQNLCELNCVQCLLTKKIFLQIKLDRTYYKKTEQTRLRQKRLGTRRFPQTRAQAIKLQENGLPPRNSYFFQISNSNKFSDYLILLDAPSRSLRQQFWRLENMGRKWIPKLAISIIRFLTGQTMKIFWTDWSNQTTCQMYSKKQTFSEDKNKC